MAVLSYIAIVGMLTLAGAGAGIYLYEPDVDTIISETGSFNVPKEMLEEDTSVVSATQEELCSCNIQTVFPELSNLPNFDKFKTKMYGTSLDIPSLKAMYKVKHKALNFEAEGTYNADGTKITYIVFSSGLDIQAVAMIDGDDSRIPEEDSGWETIVIEVAGNKLHFSEAYQFLQNNGITA